MLQNERMEWITRRLHAQGTVKVTEISEQLQVSVDTVRRDLKLMEQNGLMKCVHGGACLPDPMLSVASFTVREVVHEEQKKEAARKAVAYVRHGDIIALNSGTTNTVLAREIARRCEGITVVTNNLAAAEELMKNSAIRLILIGGEVDHTERSTYGTVCEKELATYYPDIAFLSINAVNEQDGYTDFRLSEIGIIQTFAACSHQVIAVMDSSKLGQRSKKAVLSPGQVDRLIMDGAVPPDLLERYRKCGIEIE